MVGVIVYVMVVVAMAVMVAATLRECDRLHDEASVLLANNAELAARCATLESRMPRNEHARMLDETVDAKVRERDEWQPMLVVAVSHKGSLAVRPVSEPGRAAKWIPARLVEKRVRTCKSES